MEGTKQDVNTYTSSECLGLSRHAGRLSAGKFIKTRYKSSPYRCKSLESLDTCTGRRRVGVSNQSSFGSFSDVKDGNSVVISDISTMNENKALHFEQNFPNNGICDDISHRPYISDAHHTPKFSTNSMLIQRQICEKESPSRVNVLSNGLNSVQFSAILSHEDTYSDGEGDDSHDSVMMARAIVKPADESMSDADVFESGIAFPYALSSPFVMDPFGPAESEESGLNQSALAGIKMTSSPRSALRYTTAKSNPSPIAASSSNFSPRQGNSLMDQRKVFRVCSVDKLPISTTNIQGDVVVESTPGLVPQESLAPPPPFAKNAWINVDILGLDISSPNTENLSHLVFSAQSPIPRRQERRHSTNIDYRAISSAVASTQRKQQQQQQQFPKFKSPWKVHAARARESVASFLSFTTAKSKDKRREKPGLRDKKHRDVYHSEPLIGSSECGNGSKLSVSSSTSEAGQQKETDFYGLESDTKATRTKFSHSNPELDSSDTTYDKSVSSASGSCGYMPVVDQVPSPSNCLDMSQRLMKGRAYSCSDVPDSSECDRNGVSVSKDNVTINSNEETVASMELHENCKGVSIIRFACDDDTCIDVITETGCVKDVDINTQVPNTKASGVNGDAFLNIKPAGLGESNTDTDQSCNQMPYMSSTQPSQSLVSIKDDSEECVSTNNTSPTDTKCNTEAEIKSPILDHSSSISDHPVQIIQEEDHNSMPWMSPNLRRTLRAVRNHLEKTRSLGQSPDSLCADAGQDSIETCSGDNIKESIGDEIVPDRVDSIKDLQSQLPVSDFKNLAVLESQAQAQPTHQVETRRLKEWPERPESSPEGSPFENTVAHPVLKFNSVNLEAIEMKRAEDKTENSEQLWLTKLPKDSCTQDRSLCTHQIQTFSANNDVLSEKSKTNEINDSSETLEEKKTVSHAEEISETSGSLSYNQSGEFAPFVSGNQSKCSSNQTLVTEDSDAVMAWGKTEFTHRISEHVAKDYVKESEQLNGRSFIETEKGRALCWKGKRQNAGWTLQRHKSVPALHIVTDDTNLSVTYNEYFGLDLEKLDNADIIKAMYQSGDDECIVSDKEVLFSNLDNLRQPNPHDSEKTEAGETVRSSIQDSNQVEQTNLFELDRSSCSSTETLHGSPRENHDTKSHCGVLPVDGTKFQCEDSPRTKHDTRSQWAGFPRENHDTKVEWRGSLKEQHDTRSKWNGSPREHNDAKTQWDGFLPEIDARLLSVRKLQRSDSVSSISSGMSSISITSTRSEARLGKMKASKRVDGLLANQLFRKHLARHAETLEKKVLMMHKKGMRKALSNFDLSKSPPEEIDSSLKVGDINNNDNDNSDSGGSSGEASSETTPRSGRSSHVVFPKESCSLSRSFSISDKLQSTRHYYWEQHEGVNTAKNDIVDNTSTRSTHISGESSEVSLDPGGEDKPESLVKTKPSHGYPRLLERPNQHRMHIPSFQEFKERQRSSPTVEITGSQDTELLSSGNQSPNMYVIKEDEVDDNRKKVAIKGNMHDTGKMPLVEAKSLSEEIIHFESQEVPPRRNHGSNPVVSPRSVPVFIHPAITVTAGDVSMLQYKSRRSKQLNRSKSESNIKRRQQASAMLLSPQPRDRSQTFSTSLRNKNRFNVHQSLGKSPPVVSPRSVQEDTLRCDKDPFKLSKSEQNLLPHTESKLCDDTGLRGFHSSDTGKNPVVIVSDGEVSQELSSVSLSDAQKQKLSQITSNSVQNHPKDKALESSHPEVYVNKNHISLSDAWNFPVYEKGQVFDSDSKSVDSDLSAPSREFNLAESLGFDLDDSLQDFEPVEHVDTPHFSADSWSKSMSMSALNSDDSGGFQHSSKSDLNQYRPASTEYAEVTDKTEASHYGEMFYLRACDSNIHQTEDLQKENETGTEKTARSREPVQNSVRGLRLSNADISCDDALNYSNTLEKDFGKLTSVTSLRTSPTNSSSDSDQSGKAAVLRSTSDVSPACSDERERRRRDRKDRPYKSDPFTGADRLPQHSRHLESQKSPSVSESCSLRSLEELAEHCDLLSSTLAIRDIRQSHFCQFIASLSDSQTCLYDEDEDEESADSGVRRRRNRLSNISTTSEDSGVSGHVLEDGDLHRRGRER
ncbi:hypothetical protein EGW08_012426 [Elysia chlorotica]|uniref:Uncharacterized protein n=1 Tax=Elysia chlorotica TaxID=188477 RepID=A0A433TDZ1_ELYCH|nr:hypothetical protein EGW08_012426 [Elysia chlorotica]